MSPEKVRVKTPVRVPDIQPIKRDGIKAPKKALKIDPTREGQMLELSLAAIETDLMPQWEYLPIFSDSDDILRKAGPSQGSSSDIDEEDYFDAPDMERNIEDDWREDEPIDYLAEPAEDFLQYAWRRWEEDFVKTDDENMRRVEATLKQWEDPYFSLLLDSIDEDLRPWFETLEYAYPFRQREERIIPIPQPDIIFSVGNNGIIEFTINLGTLERMHIRQSVGSDTQEIPWVQIAKKNGTRITTTIPINALTGLKKARYTALSTVAEFLKDKQSAFLHASDPDKASMRLQPLLQKDFLDFAKQKGHKRDKTWAFRVITNKLVKVPFANQLFPLNFFFNITNLKIMYLQKAFEIQVIRGQNPPLTAPDQVKLLQSFGFKDVNQQKVRHTLWSHLRNIYPPHLWDNLKIIGESGNVGESNRIPHKILKELIQKIAAIYTLPYDDSLIK